MTCMGLVKVLSLARMNSKDTLDDEGINVDWLIAVFACTVLLVGIWAVWFTRKFVVNQPS